MVRIILASIFLTFSNCLMAQEKLDSAAIEEKVVISDE
jgi:hypothetical protein